VSYQSGSLIDQYTIFYKNDTLKEYAIIKVRTSPHIGPNLLEIQVNMAPIPVDDDQGKDVVVMWKMYDGFDANGTFRTDANGWATMTRKVRTTFDAKIYDEMMDSHNKPSKNSVWSRFIGRNFYPVDSSISMDDTKSNKRVTIMNDRAQGGSADLSVKGSIELIQNRRLVWNDDLGLYEPLNETDHNDHGLRINAKYFMEISPQSDSAFK
jgi:hypothetical protein